MTRDEAFQLVDWAAGEGWNPGLDDAALFWATDPDAFVAAERDGIVIGGGAVTSYNGAFGFMGLFIVRPEFRRRGLGHAGRQDRHEAGGEDGKTRGRGRHRKESPGRKAVHHRITPQENTRFAARLARRCPARTPQGSIGGYTTELYRLFRARPNGIASGETGSALGLHGRQRTSVRTAKAVPYCV